MRRMQEACQLFQGPSLLSGCLRPSQFMRAGRHSGQAGAQRAEVVLRALEVVRSKGRSMPRCTLCNAGFAQFHMAPSVCTRLISAAQCNVRADTPRV